VEWTRADRTNKKAELIALMKRSKGATQAEIMPGTKGQAHTVRGLSILGKQGGDKIEAGSDSATPDSRSLGKD
jgi:hypothetical protein